MVDFSISLLLFHEAAERLARHDRQDARRVVDFSISLLLFHFTMAKDEPRRSHVVDFSISLLLTSLLLFFTCFIIILL